MSQSPAAPAAPPQYSPDGRFWWDGTRWLEVQMPPAVPAQVTPAQVTPAHAGDSAWAAPTRSVLPQQPVAARSSAPGGGWRRDPRAAVNLWLKLSIASAVLGWWHDAASGTAAGLLLAYGMAWIGVLGLLTWRVWRRGRFAYWIVLPALLTLTAVFVVVLVVDPAALGYGTAPQHGYAAGYAVLDVLSAVVLYGSTLRRHVGPLRRRRSR